MEQQLQAANSENYLLQMQLTKLQSTLKQTQTKLKTVQAWRDVSEAEGEAVEGAPTPRSEGAGAGGGAFAIFFPGIGVGVGGGAQPSTERNVLFSALPHQFLK